MPRKKPDPSTWTKTLMAKGEERRRLTAQLVDLVGRAADQIVATVPDGTEIRAPWSVSDRLRIVEYRSSVDSYRALAVVQGAPGWETQAAFVRGRTPGSSFYLHRDFGCQIHVASREDYLNLANHLPEVVRAFEAREDAVIAALREGFERLKAMAEATEYSHKPVVNDDYIDADAKDEGVDYDCYLALNESAHGKRYWRTGADPDTLRLTAPDRTLCMLGPITVGPGGFRSEEEAAAAIATTLEFDLEDPATWDSIDREDPAVKAIGIR